MASLDLHRLARAEVEVEMVAASVDKNDARTGELLEDETFATEEPRTETPDHGDVELDGALCKKEPIALNHDGLTGGKFEDLDFTRVVAGEPDLAVAGLSTEVGEEQRFAHQFPLERPDDLVGERLTGHAGGPIDVGRLVNHLAGFGVDLLARLQMDTSNLEVVALNVVAERFWKGCRIVAGWGGITAEGLTAIDAEFRGIVELSPAVGAEGHDNYANES